MLALQHHKVGVMLRGNKEKQKKEIEELLKWIPKNIAEHREKQKRLKELENAGKEKK